ncbi:MAG: WXG100 family type VII secretion target [Chloroflexi bacterium]|nr:WXG100 family type VII secretion target [Chloroflexota bacterium]
MNYGSMEEMAKAFNKAAEDIASDIPETDTAAQMMEDGALQGMAGDAFRQALQGKLKRRLKVLADKMKELEGDIKGAVSATRDGVSTAQSRFK